jgi:hypothetical protein
MFSERPALAKDRSCPPLRSSTNLTASIGYARNHLPRDGLMIDKGMLTTWLLDL